jgi:hypothetical protein
MPRPRTKVEAALRAKGFALEEGDHHYFIYVSEDGLVTNVKTKTSHGAKMKDIPDNLLAAMARQVSLSRSEFVSFVDCDLDRRTYEGRLRAAGKLGSSGEGA